MHVNGRGRPTKETSSRYLQERQGKGLLEKMTFWLRQFNSNSDLNSIALKAFMILLSLMLQKPSATSKTKEHSAA